MSIMHLVVLLLLQIRIFFLFHAINRLIGKRIVIHQNLFESIHESVFEHLQFCSQGKDPDIMKKLLIIICMV